MKIGIGNDHAAVTMKNEIKAYLEELGHEVVDFGISKEESCDYPVYGEAVGTRCCIRSGGMWRTYLRYR